MYSITLFLLVTQDTFTNFDSTPDTTAVMMPLDITPASYTTKITMPRRTMIKRLLACPNATASLFMSPVTTAIYNRLHINSIAEHAAIIDKLLKYMPNINENTPLHCALCHKHKLNNNKFLTFKNILKHYSTCHLTSNTRNPYTLGSITSTPDKKNTKNPNKTAETPPPKPKNPYIKSSTPTPKNTPKSTKKENTPPPKPKNPYITSPTPDQKNTPKPNKEENTPPLTPKNQTIIKKKNKKS